SKTGMLSGLDRQAEIGSFFFRRSGYVAAMRAAYIDHAQQSGSRLAALAAHSGDAILWIGGASYPDGWRNIAGFDCRGFGSGVSRSLACVTA
ncbi:MAG: hypothetical protein ABIS14_14965, partial [Sphingomonas sp.]